MPPLHGLSVTGRGYSFARRDGMGACPSGASGERGGGRCGVRQPLARLPGGSACAEWRVSGDVADCRGHGSFSSAARGSWSAGTGSGGALAPTRSVGELLRMAFLFLPVLRYEIRQDDIRVTGVVGLCARSHVSSVGAGLVRHDHGPAMERDRGASLVCDPDRGCGGFSRWRKVEPVHRNLNDARPLQKDVMRNSCAPGTIPVLARKHTPAEVFPLSDAIGDRHAARVSRCSSSARASRTNPSGSPRVSE